MSIQKVSIDLRAQTQDKRIFGGENNTVRIYYFDNVNNPIFSDEQIKLFSK